jgi:hypothetical protein
MRLLTLAAVAAISIGAAGPANSGDVCDDLWIQRNQIYKDNGYCFKTRNAIRFFGNAGCSYDDVNDVPLSSREQREVQRIVRAERRYGCKG